VAIACIGKDIMPTEDRGEIGHIEPSGWKQAKYDCISGNGYLYHRCHLIGFQLAGENDNKLNLITGTGYMNVTGMLPFENMIDDYVEETGNHVMYRVTPIYAEKYDLVACGVLMEAYSVEDKGDGICFNVFCYNVEPGVAIDYYDGSSWLDGENPPPKDDDNNDDNNVDDSGDGDDVGDGEVTYIINTSTKKIHLTTCRYATSNNTKETTKSLEELLAENYTTCGTCKPEKSE
jgi:DNA-entry nuclease